MNLFGYPLKELAASPVTVADGVAYASTGLGFVAAVDIRSGVPRWVASYEIIPIDNEGSYLLRKIPVISVEMASGSKEMAKKVSEALRGYKVVMQRGHGCFAIGQTLESLRPESRYLDLALRSQLARSRP